MSEIRELRRQYEEAEPVRINCGVYVRPRSFECWLGGQLNAANQRIKELIRDYAAMRIEASKEFFRAEAAERKLATARAEVAKIPYRQCDEHGCKWRTGCLSCAEAKSQNTHLDSAIKALAQIEQPQGCEAKTA